ncbi:MAG: B-box zinc finger protein, partial [Anaerolineales bacterium]
MTLEVEELFCVNHPQTETTLRCNRCEDPICARCAVLTPTGYRCKDCIRGLQKSFDTAEWYDYGVSFILAGFLSYLG